MERIDRIERAIEEMTKGYERHDRILANLEANQIVMGKAMDSIKEDVHGIREDMGRMARAMNNFMDMVGMKFKEHEER